MEKIKIIESKEYLEESILKRKKELKENIKITFDSEKIKQNKELFFQFYKDSITLSKIFIGCKELLMNIEDDEIQDYLFYFKELDILQNYIEYCEAGSYGNHLDLIREIVKENRSEMLKLIFLTNKLFGLFEEDSEEMEFNMGGLKF